MDVPPPLSSKAVFPPCGLHLSHPATSSLPPASATRQELHPAHPFTSAIWPLGSASRQGGHQVSSGRVTSPQEGQQRGALDLQPEDCTNILVLSNLNSRQILSVIKRMTVPVHRSALGIKRLCVSELLFLCTTAACLILNFHPATPPQRCHSTSLPSNSTSLPDPIKSVTELSWVGKHS